MTSLHRLRLVFVAIVLLGVTPERGRAEVSSQRAADGHDLALPILIAQTDDPADGFTGRGSPSRRSSGGSRGDCSDLLVALVPGDDVLAVSETGCSLPSSSEPALTTAAMPVLWFHVPAQSEPIKGEFALLDAQQLALSVQAIALPQTGGIVGIQVDTELDVGHTYNWVFSMLTNPRTPSENPRVAGTVQRISPSPEALIEINAAENLQDQAEIWFSLGVWHNALTAVATSRQSALNQTGAEQQWQEFLGTAGLGAIADAPIYPEFTPPDSGE